MKAVYAILSLFLLFTVSVSAQQNDNWYFGKRAALSFNPPGGGPAPMALTNSELDTDEGSASISDDEGNLLFYTNGVKVYNKLHQLMANGDNLSGNISTTQVAIVPWPGSDSLYYIFTTDAIEHGYANGYRYSVVDMDAASGNGMVIQKNIPLWSSCSERLTTARHANGSDVWVILNGNSSNIFQAYLVTCSGIQAAPVVSIVGAQMNDFYEQNTGVMKVSPDGRLFAHTHFPTIGIGGGPPPNFFQLFDFDNATGILSNARQFTFPSTQYTHCEFSPNSRFLYLTRPYERKLDQFDVSLGTVPAISASRTTIDMGSVYFDIQLAPDEKIYLAQIGVSLGVIEQPNVAGAGCNFVPDGVWLTTGSTFIGLPSHINDIVLAATPNAGFTYTILDSCSGTVQFNAYSSTPGATYEWDFGDGNSSTQQNPINVYSPAGISYTVKLKIGYTTNCGKIFRSARIKPSGTLVSIPDFDHVVRCDSGYVRFINTTPALSSVASSMTWDFGDGNTSTATHPIHTYANAGNYFVKLSLNTGLACMNQSTTIPVEVRDFKVVLPPDQTILVGQSVLLNTNEPGTSYHWSPSTWLNDTSIRNPVATPLDDITYTLVATNGEGCKGKDSIRIRVIQFDDVYVPNAFTPNNDGKNDQLRPYFPGSMTLKEFAIFNRWGHKIFSTATRGIGWDGKTDGMLQTTNTYVWMLRLIDKDGTPIERKGTFTLIR